MQPDFTWDFWKRGTNFMIAENLSLINTYSKTKPSMDFYAKYVEFSELENNCLNLIILLKERRTALISSAVTGKIDVRHWQPPTPL